MTRSRMVNLVAALALAGCELADEPAIDDDAAEVLAGALDPGASVGGGVFRELGAPAYFSVRRYDPYTFEIDVAGDPSSLVTCPGATSATPVCFVPRLNLAHTGLTLAQQTTVLQRVATNGSEGSTAVVMGGALVSVRDNRPGGVSYVEFRATSVYLAPSVRPHGNRFLRAYVLAGRQVFDVTRTYNLPVPVTIQLAFPPGEPLPALPLTDHIVTATLLSETPDAQGRFPTSVTQVFRRFP